jgi:hypothetical protein
MSKGNDQALIMSKMDELHRIEDKYRKELFLPPFQNRHNPFYLVGGIKKDSAMFKKIAKEIESTGLQYTTHDVKGNLFMEILGVR